MFLQSLVKLLRVIGPGVIVMFADNDFGGLDTYIKAGYEYKYLPVAIILLSLPILYINQNMVVKLGSITQTGHAQLIRRHFNKFWMFFTVIDMSLSNIITMISNFAGLVIVLKYLNLNTYIFIPLLVLLIVVISITGKFTIWERAMFVLIFVNLLFIPLAFKILPSLHINHVVFNGHGGAYLENNFIYLALGILGTTIAPWQLFFQQANIVDKGLSKKDLLMENIDTFIGVVCVGIVAVFLTSIGYVTKIYEGAGKYTGIDSSIGILAQHYPQWAHIFFLILILNASLMGVCVITITSAYGISEMLDKPGGLSSSFRKSPVFYLIITLFLIVSGAFVLFVPINLSLLVFYAQILSGVLLPVATLTLLILCNEKSLLGKYTNGIVMNLFSSTTVLFLISISLYLNLTSLFKLNISSKHFFLISILLSIVLGILITIYYRVMERKYLIDKSEVEKDNRALTAGLIFLRVYVTLSFFLILLSIFF